MKEPGTFSKPQDLGQWILKRKENLCKAKGCSRRKGSRNRKAEQQKTKAVIKTNLVKLCVVQKRATQTDPVQEQAEKMI